MSFPSFQRDPYLSFAGEEVFQTIPTLVSVPSLDSSMANGTDGNIIQEQPDSPASSCSSSPKSTPAATRQKASGPMKARSSAHITQQQVNKKRQRATPEQLIVLEEAFSANPSPNAKVREAISAQISMTERSVQIWFQNRYDPFSLASMHALTGVGERKLNCYRRKEVQVTKNPVHLAIYSPTQRPQIAHQTSLDLKALISADPTATTIWHKIPALWLAIRLSSPDCVAAP